MFTGVKAPLSTAPRISGSRHFHFVPTKNIQLRCASSIITTTNTTTTNSKSNNLFLKPSKSTCRFQSTTTKTRRSRRRRDGGETSSSSNAQQRNQNDDESSSMNNPNESVHKITNKSKFLQEASSFLSKAEKALEPMKNHNDIFNIHRSSNEHGETLTIGLAPSEGQYVLQVDEDLLTLSLRSPMSGNYTYVLCANTNEFVGMEDNHKLEGMIVRDLIRHCNGLPKF